MFKNILEKPEQHRRRLALGLSIALSTLIFVGWASYRGFIKLPSLENVKVFERPVAEESTKASDTPSPIENSKEVFAAAFEEIYTQYLNVKESLSSVLVPFVTNIDVYQR